MNLFENPEVNEAKLKAIIREFGGLFIGVDFDDTIRDFDTGEPIEPVVTVLKELSKLGHRICLYTCREGEDLAYAKRYCKGMGIVIDYYNWSPLYPEVRKPLFNILLDDRAGLVESVELCKRIINFQKSK